MNILMNCSYFISAVLLVIGLKGMSSPKTASRGFRLASLGMLIAVIITAIYLFSIENLTNFILMLTAIFIGSLLAIYSGMKVKMIQMPQMIALYNAMGGGAASAIAIIESLKTGPNISFLFIIITLFSVIIGTLSFSGSLIAFAKLHEWLKKPILLPGHLFINLLLIAVIIFSISNFLLWPLVICLILLGIMFALPIGGANMPIVISLFNAMTGLAVAGNGLSLSLPLLIIAGLIVGVSGMLLTYLMAKAMNQSLKNILLMPLKKSRKTLENNEPSAILKSLSIEDAAISLAYANTIIIVPGYGMAVAQAQYKIWELTQLLEKRNIKVKFAIHPVAGRMPGHMNVLLAEAGVPYEKIADMEDINASFPTTDVVIVIGANDVVNPAARLEAGSPIYGMPILEAGLAKQVIVIKRGDGKGFSGVENKLFTQDNVHMLYGQGSEVVQALVQAVKAL